MTIGDRIKKLRENKKMTQEELVTHIHSKKQTIYKYENNIVTNIPSDKINIIAGALNTSPQYLMGWADSKNVNVEKYDMSKTPLYTALKKLEIGENELTSDEINSIVKYLEFIKNNK